MREIRDGQTTEWAEARPIPARVSVVRMLRRLVWNPRRNQQLYMVGLAERLADTPTQHSKDELAHMVRASLAPVSQRAGGQQTGSFAYRVIFVQREGEELVRFLDYESPEFPIDPPVEMSTP